MLSHLPLILAVAALACALLFWAGKQAVEQDLLGIALECIIWEWKQRSLGAFCRVCLFIATLSLWTWGNTTNRIGVGLIDLLFIAAALLLVFEVVGRERSTTDWLLAGK